MLAEVGTRKTIQPYKFPPIMGQLYIQHPMLKVYDKYRNTTVQRNVYFFLFCAYVHHIWKTKISQAILLGCLTPFSCGNGTTIVFFFYFLEWRVMWVCWNARLQHQQFRPSEHLSFYNCWLKLPVTTFLYTLCSTQDLLRYHLLRFNNVM